MSGKISIIRILALLAFGFVTAMLASFATYWYMTHPVETPEILANKPNSVKWFDYVNEKGKYQFLYPSSWTLSEQKGSVNTASVKYSIDEFVVSYYEKNRCKQEDITKTYTSHLSEKQGVIVGGKVSRTFEGVPDETNQMVYLVPGKTFCYEISMSYKSTSNKETLDKIMKSFKLLD